MRLREEGQLWADQLCRRASGPSVHQRKFQRSLWILEFRYTIRKVKDATKDLPIPVFWSLSNPQISYQNKYPTDIHKYEWILKTQSPSVQCRTDFLSHLPSRAWLFGLGWQTKKFDSKYKKRMRSNVCVQRLCYCWGN